MSGRSSRCPFTASQWQELQRQALIFKYMASGIPVPHDLILPIHRGFYPDTHDHFPHHPDVGWGAQMACGRKPEDPEPWRCRRTDGKKWRCSKEAHPDSKYCERHMHRGKNRSRKPVEIISVNAHSTACASSATFPNPSRLAGGGASQAHRHMYPPFSSPGDSGAGFLPLGGGAPHFHMDAASADRDVYRYCHGVKEGGVDQYAFFSDEPQGERKGPWRFTPLGMSSLGDPKQRSGTTSLDHGGFLPGAELQKGEEEREQEDKRRHCFVLGTDFKLEAPAKEEGDGETQRPLRHLFDDWPTETRETCTRSDEERQRGWPGGFPVTQLSISIPMAPHDFPTAG